MVAAAASDASSPRIPTQAPAPSAPWCVRSLPTANARAIDPHGHVFALRGGAVVDETAGSAPVRLPASNPPCSVQLAHLAFASNGSAAAIWAGRVYFRPRGASTWVMTPVCTDLGGEPWAPRLDGAGWAVIGRRFAARDPALLMTEEATASTGWYAITALDPTMTGLSLEGGGSFVALTSGGHAVLVDRERHVAGEILAANDALWPSITRTEAGVVLARDESPVLRDLVLGTTVTGRFDRQRRPRPAGPRTLAAYAGEFGRVLAATNQGVEWSVEPAAPFVEVARWPGSSAPGSSAEISMGWLGDGVPAIVTTHALVARRCPADLHAP